MSQAKMVAKVLLLAASALLLQSWATFQDVDQALGADSECGADGGPSCALNALQQKGRKVASSMQAAAEGSEMSDSSMPSCSSYGCQNYYKPWNLCQCNEDCGKHSSCCGDYVAQCAAPAPPPPGPPAIPRTGPYKLNWEAKGESFFDTFEFLKNDDNHGAADYLSKDDALTVGVAKAYGTHAILTAGPASKTKKYKRTTAKISTKKNWKYFLAAMKYSHVPFGCGVWPAFFTLAPNAKWPYGGEVDILEYVNSDVSKASVHGGESCTLNAQATQKYGKMPDRNAMNYDCVTKYPSKLGCAPNKWMKTGQAWSNSPGVIAMQWTDEFIKIFFFPEDEVPEGFDSDSPEPDTWDTKYLFSYYPLKESGCSSNFMQEQQLIMQVNFCGDWAGKVWGQDRTCKHLISGCRSVDPLREYAPAQDCCTQFISDETQIHKTQDYLSERAFFNISWMKVYQQDEQLPGQ